MPLPAIFHPSLDFESSALEIFQEQSGREGIYKKYIDTLEINPSEIKTIQQIPFLPIAFFKTHEIKDPSRETQQIFKSSGTTGMDVSKHFIADTELYIKSFTTGFQQFYGDIKKVCFLALLPSYLERNDSSLVYMCSHLINQSGHPSSGFYLNNLSDLSQQLKALRDQHQPVILIGVSYALLDLAASFPLDFPELIIIETGGMKGRREEMIREEVHALLKKSFNVKSIHSEYGMTELLSQAWSKGNGLFECPPWMKILIRHINDPFQLVKENQSGAINIIDLANYYSCSFIATDDIGRMKGSKFEVLGRLDNSDLRGCNLLVD